MVVETPKVRVRIGRSHDDRRRPVPAADISNLASGAELGVSAIESGYPRLNQVVGVARPEETLGALEEVRIMLASRSRRQSERRPRPWEQSVWQPSSPGIRPSRTPDSFRRPTRWPAPHSVRNYRRRREALTSGALIRELCRRGGPPFCRAWRMRYAEVAFEGLDLSSHAGIIEMEAVHGPSEAELIGDHHG